MLKAISVFALAVALLMSFSTPVKAETLTGTEATVTFDRPVEVPGKVLPPGTYVLKTMSNDEIVQVFSANQKQVFATLSVIPQDRPAEDVNLDSFVQLNKTHTGAPQEVEGFFVAGRNIGFQFIYPNNQARR